MSLEQELKEISKSNNTKQDRGKKTTFDKTVKNKTMNDLVFKEIAQESHLKTTESGLITEKEIPLIGMDLNINLNNKGIEAQKEKWNEYNKSVMSLNKRYSEGIEFINGDILVRLFKKPIVDKFGLIKQHTCQAQLRNGAFKIMPDRLAFNFIGVIVNLDKVLENKFPKGTVIQVSPDVSLTQVYAEEFQILRHGYFRDGDEDENFSNLGYVLIKQNQLISILKDFNIEDYIS